MVVCLVLLCFGYDLSYDIVEKYWLNLGIENSVDRFEFLIETQKDIFRNGPLWNIANMILIQLGKNNKTSRGAFHDGFHSLYLAFLDIFLTNDRHFINIREAANKEYFDLFYKKIYHLNELDIKYHNREVEPPTIDVYET